MLKLTKNFSLRELKCKDGTHVPQEYMDNARAICERAQVLRELVGFPLIVVSGYRTGEYNASLPNAATNSKHLTASALDLHCERFSADQLAILYNGLIRLELIPDGGLGIYPRTGPGRDWIHIDLGRRRSWRG